MAEIKTAHLFTTTLRVGQSQPVGKTPGGERLVVPVLDGTFEGDRIRGTVLPGGSDWILNRPDGALQLNVRLVLKTDDGALIGVTYSGLRHGPADVLEKLWRGEEVDPALYYFRVAMLFETASDKYAWLNRIIAVGTGTRRPDGPIYDVFEVL